jgi:hypothetical protein
MTRVVDHVMCALSAHITKACAAYVAVLYQRNVFQSHINNLNLRTDKIYNTCEQMFDPSSSYQSWLWRNYDSESPP